MTLSKSVAWVRSEIFPPITIDPRDSWCIGFWMLWSDDSIFTFPIFNSICVRVNNTLTIIRVIKRAIRWNRGHRNAYSVMSRRVYKPFIIKNREHKNRATYLLNQCLVSLLMMWIFSAILGTFRCHLIGSTERVHSVTSNGHPPFFSQSFFGSRRFTLVVVNAANRIEHDLNSSLYKMMPGLWGRAVMKLHVQERTINKQVKSTWRSVGSHYC